MSKFVDVGEPPSQYTRWESVEVHYHDFENLGATPLEKCLGNDLITFFPRGIRSFTANDGDGTLITNRSSDGMAALVMNNVSARDIKVDLCFSVRNDIGEEIVHVTRPQTEFGTYKYMVLANFAKRSTLLNCLVDGTLTVEIRLRNSRPHLLKEMHIPINPFSKNMLQLFMEEESADVVFQVGEQHIAEGHKVTKTSQFNFHAHRLILQQCASSMADMCGERREGMTVVPINDIKPEIFKQVLYFVYGGAVPEEVFETNAREIIDAADKLGVVTLKLQAEASFVKATTISVDNLMDNLLYADSKNCALLKEAVIDFVVDNGKEVLDKVRLEDVPGGMFRDLLTAVARKEGSKSNTGGDEDELNTLGVSELRRKLDEKGLGVDGSREAMISTLKECADDQ